MGRVDIGATLSAIDFPQRTWDQLDLLGEVIRVTDAEALRLDAVFHADTPYKGFLVAMVREQLSSLKAVYLLLRAELVHQAASHVRLFCEGVISLRYISLDPDVRTSRFLDYAAIEAYDAAMALMEWEARTAPSAHVARLKTTIELMHERYDSLRPLYQSPRKGGGQRNYRNWSDVSIASQAKEGGEKFERLYRLVYAQMSAYVHGSAWSLRHSHAYSQKAHHAETVYSDVAAVVTASIAVWIEFASLAKELLDGRLAESATAIVNRARSLAGGSGGGAA